MNLKSTLRLVYKYGKLENLISIVKSLESYIQDKNIDSTCVNEYVRIRPLVRTYVLEIYGDFARVLLSILGKAHPRHA